jgi:hypothetical protein
MIDYARPGFSVRGVDDDDLPHSFGRPVVTEIVLSAGIMLMERGMVCKRL